MKKNKNNATVCRNIISAQRRTNNAQCNLQYHKGREVGKCVIWDVCDLVERQRHGLQGGQRVKRHHWDLRQGVVI